MDEKMLYKVLWVDNDADMPLPILAEVEYGIEFCLFKDWTTAKPVLEKNFYEWSAIVLDYYCCVDDKSGETDKFISEVLPELNRIFGEKRCIIPWYVFSAGSRDDFERNIQYQIAGRDIEWDNGEKDRKVYKKNANDRISLLKNIRCVAEKSDNNRIRGIYRNVFEVIEKNRNYLDPKTKDTMFEILKALHYPEKMIEFNHEVYYNQLRHLLEYIYRGCKEIGLLPDDFIKPEGVNLMESNRYLSGLASRVYHVKCCRKLFPDIIAENTKQILTISNTCSHTKDKHVIESAQGYFNDIGSANLLFSYALQICDVVIWFGNCVKENLDIEENKKLCETIKDNQPEYYEGNSYVIDIDGRNHPYCNRVELPTKLNGHKGKKVKLNKVITNKNEKDTGYPLYASSCDLVNVK